MLSNSFFIIIIINIDVFFFSFVIYFKTIFHHLYDLLN